MFNGTKAAVIRIMLVALIAALAAGFSPQGTALAGDICVNLDGSGGCYTDLQLAVNAATAGDTITVAAGTYPLAALVTVNKAVTVTGAGSSLTIFEVSGTGHRLALTAAGAVLENVAFYKTDKGGVQNIVYISASNVTVRGSLFHGQYVLGDPDVSRAMEVTGGINGVAIEGNTVYGLRQPAYINTAQGSILNNTVYGTRGWVIDGGVFTFTGNSWGDGSQPNAVDIALLNNVDPTYKAAYADLPALSAANNNAVIENQRVAPFELSDVFVDDNAAPGGNGTKIAPYDTITPAFARSVVGGTINVAAGVYNEAVSITKANVELLGAGRTVTTIKGPKTGSSATLEFKANGVLVDGFKITRDGNNPTDWATNAKTSGVAIFDVSGVTLRNSEVSGNRNGVYFNGFNTANNTVKDNIITNNRTGVNVFRGSTGNVVRDNEISNNWTFGVIFIPMADTTVSGFTFTHNRITNNWYAQVADRNNSDTGVINFEENYFGVSTPDFHTENIVEPGYVDQIPVEFGGTATDPAGYHSVVDPEPNFSTLDYTPWCFDETCTKLISSAIFLPILAMP